MSRQYTVVVLLALGTADLVWLNYSLLPAAFASMSPHHAATVARATDTDASREVVRRPAMHDPAGVTPDRSGLAARGEVRPAVSATEAENAGPGASRARLAADETNVETDDVHGNALALDDEPRSDVGNEPEIRNVDVADVPATESETEPPDERQSIVDNQPDIIETAPGGTMPSAVPVLASPRLSFAELGSAELSSAARQALDELINTLEARPDIMVELRGHTDRTGSEGVNRVLSRRRAETAAAYLIERGVAPDRIRTRGVGSREPLNTGKSARAMRRNRRVDIHLHKDD